jgi:hypothetical protein
MVSDNNALVQKASSVYVINDGQCRIRKEQSSQFRPVLDVEMVNPDALPGSCNNLGGGSRVRAPVQRAARLSGDDHHNLPRENRRIGRYGGPPLIDGYRPQGTATTCH